MSETVETTLQDSVAQPVDAVESNQTPAIDPEAVKAAFFNSEPVAEPNKMAEIIEAKLKEQEAPKEEPKSEETPKDEVKAEEAVKPSDILEVKINGEIKELSLEQIKTEHPEVLEQLKSGVSAQKEIQRRFSEIDKSKKELEAERLKFKEDMDNVQAYLDKFSDMTKDGNPLGGLEFLGQVSGEPPYIVREKLIAQLAPEIIRRQSLTQQDLEFELTKLENSYVKEQRESETKRMAKEQAARQQAELQAKLDSIRQTHNIDESSWDNAVKDIANSGNTNPTIEQVVEKAKEIKWVAESAQYCAAIAKQENLTLAEFEDLKQTVAQYPQFNEQDIVELVQEYKASKNQAKTEKAEQNLANKLSKNQTKQVSSASELTEQDIKNLRKKFLKDNGGIANGY